MNRLLWGIALLIMVAGGGWAQSTWRGQAEIWTSADAPVDGFVAASNEFPRNSLLTVENYKTRKSIQVRVVSTLPVGASALVLLNGKAAQALDMKAGEIPLVGVRMDPVGVDRPDNPDPDVNPLAGRPGGLALVPKTGVPSAVTPTTPVASVASTPAPTLVPVAKDTTARTPSASLDVNRGTTTLDPNLLPLPALAAPEVVEPAERTPLPVAEDSETPVTPGRRVFVTTRDSSPVATEVPVAEAPAAEIPAPAPVVETVEPPPAAPEPAVATAPSPEPAVEAPSVVVAPPAVEAPPVVEAPSAVVEAPTPVPAPLPPVAEVPAVEPPAAEPPVPEVPKTVPAVAVPVKPTSGWVSTPGKLEGPVLGAVPVLPGLEKGKYYVQVGSWASEAELLKALGTVKSYVPLALYQALGEKNPWRVVVATAPKGQLGLLLMHFRSQGFRSAALVKG